VTRRRVGLLVAVLAAWNLVINLVVPEGWYVPANLAMGAALVLLARRSGLKAAELGMERRALGPGLRFGLIAALVVTVLLLALASWPWVSRFFEDEPFAALGVGGILYQVLVRIPLGTALFEEVAFRGVLLGTMMRHGSTGNAVAVSSALFGLWHIVPTMVRLDQNPAGDYAINGLAHVGLVSLAVVATAMAGIVFCWLRLRSRSLAAPVVVHAVANGVAAWIAWVVIG
jgi:membrane protease YdiL (CAAX protease family)